MSWFVFWALKAVVGSGPLGDGRAGVHVLAPEVYFSGQFASGDRFSAGELVAEMAVRDTR